MANRKPLSPGEKRARKLVRLANAQFPDLTEAERDLFRAAARGEDARYGPWTDREKDRLHHVLLRARADHRRGWAGLPSRVASRRQALLWRLDSVATSVDPGRADTWPKDRALRAACIAWLCTDPEAAQLVAHPGLVVRGALIDGGLDLHFATVPFPLAFFACALACPLSLHHARLPFLGLVASHTKDIRADGVTVDGAVNLRQGFRADGEVRLLGARIGGNLDCAGGQYQNPGKHALNADGVEVDGTVFLSERFRAEGDVRLLGARIGGNLECDRGQFHNPGKDALSAEGVDVRGAVFLRGGFSAHGQVSLVGAKVQLGFQWRQRELQTPDRAVLDLRLARIRTLWDDEASWPKPGNLRLHGLAYGNIDDDAPLDAESRLRWLRLQPGYQAQPYEHLAEVLRKHGLEEEAKDVLVGKNDERLAHLRREEAEPLTRAWLWFLGLTIGYGYRLRRVLWWIGGFWAMGVVFFLAGYWGGALQPVPGRAYEPLCALVYSADAFVQVVDLGQARAWWPDAAIWPCGWFLRLYAWLHIAAGWVFTTLVIVGLTGLVRRIGRGE